MAALNFDANTVKPEMGFPVLPAGDYLAAITDSGTKPTKKGDGSYTQLVWQILEGDQKGQKLFVRLNLDNPNQTAVRLARAELSCICHAIGVLTPKDTQELHNIPAVLTVALRKSKQGEDENTIKAYASRKKQQQQTPADTPADDAAPW